jgi:ABC-type glycerol-3-phosphate transport system permease component
VAIAVSSLAGFVYSRYRGHWLSGSMYFLICIRLIPPIVVTLPLFPMVNWLGLNDTHIVLIILYATFFVSLGTVLMRTFVDGVDWGVLFAAATVQLLPVLLFVIVMNRFLVAGLTAGATKG